MDDWMGTGELQGDWLAATLLNRMQAAVVELHGVHACTDEAATSIYVSYNFFEIENKLNK